MNQEHAYVFTPNNDATGWDQYSFLIVSFL